MTAEGKDCIWRNEVRVWIYFGYPVGNSWWIIMSPAVNDLYSDTLSRTTDNGVLGKLTNPVVNLLPVQQETVCKLALVLNKISVLQSTVLLCS